MEVKWGESKKKKEREMVEWESNLPGQVEILEKEISDWIDLIQRHFIHPDDILKQRVVYSVLLACVINQFLANKHQNTSERDESLGILQSA